MWHCILIQLSQWQINEERERGGGQRVHVLCKNRGLMLVSQKRGGGVQWITENTGAEEQAALQNRLGFHCCCLGDYRGMTT